MHCVYGKTEPPFILAEQHRRRGCGQKGIPSLLQLDHVQLRTGVAYWVGEGIKTCNHDS